MDANRDLYLSDESYLAALRRFKSLIEAGEPFWKFDNDDIGNKDTQAAWGLCRDGYDVWPDKGDHLFDSRPSTKYRGKQPCPFDKQLADPKLAAEADGNASGCFYRCRIFQGRRPTRDEAVQLYADQIRRIELCVVAPLSREIVPVEVEP